MLCPISSRCLTHLDKLQLRHNIGYAALHFECSAYVSEGLGVAPTNGLSHFHWQEVLLMTVVATHHIKHKKSTDASEPPISRLLSTDLPTEHALACHGSSMLEHPEGVFGAVVSARAHTCAGQIGTRHVRSGVCR